MRKRLQQQRMHSLQYQYCPFLIPTDLLACVLMQADKGLVLSYSSKAMISHGISSKLALALCGNRIRDPGNMLGYTEMQALLDRVAALFCHYRS